MYIGVWDEDMPADSNTNRIAGLEALLKEQAGKAPLPVEQWDPPYCGDIGMRIRADGVWLYQGSPIGRAALVKLFAGVLRKDADGRHSRCKSGEAGLDRNARDRCTRAGARVHSAC